MWFPNFLVVVVRDHFFNTRTSANTSRASSDSDEPPHIGDHFTCLVRLGRGIYTALLMYFGEHFMCFVRTIGKCSKPIRSCVRPMYFGEHFTCLVRTIATFGEHLGVCVPAMYFGEHFMCFVRTIGKFMQPSLL